MKSVLISIQPKWVEKICHEIGKENGKPIYEKVVEVRKTRPKIETPFKCYIYATWNGSKKEILVKQDGRLFCEDWRKASGLQRASGKVIGEFVCDSIIDIPFKKHFLYYGKKMFHSNNCCKEACLSYIELEDYLGNKDGYGWHISDLKIYDKPKELREFWTIKCTNKRNGCQDCKVKPSCIKTITRPPQSWCYVESLGE